MNEKDKLALRDLLYLVFSAGYEKGYEAGYDGSYNLDAAFDSYFKRVLNNEKNSYEK